MTEEEKRKALEDLQGKLAKIHQEEQQDISWKRQISVGSTVKIADDHMSAWIYLYPPVSEKYPYTVSTLKEYLQQHGVKYGIKDAKLQEILHDRIYKEEVLVAVAESPELSSDGYFEYFFPVEVPRRPAERPDGTVDYATASELPNVCMGEKLAQYHPADPGKAGMDVCGDVIPVMPVQELPVMHSRNMNYNEMTRTYYAAVDGKAVLRNGKIDVKQVHQIVGNVDMTTPKVEFFGDIEIDGNVESGVIIRAGRNIRVRGSVENAQLFAGGDILLDQGMQGSEKGTISCNGSVYADFLEYTQVKCGEDVQCNYILYSQIDAGDRVVISGKKGCIVGGRVHANDSIITGFAGNEHEVKTLLHVENRPGAKILVKDTVYPGVIISIDHAAQLVQEEKKNACYKMVDYKLVEEEQYN